MIFLPNYFLAMNRRNKVAIQLGLDFILVSFSLIFAILLHSGSTALLAQSKVWAVAFFSVSQTLILFYFSGLYRALVRFITGKILIIIGKGALISAGVLYGLGLALGVDISVSIPLLYLVLTFLSVGGSRFIIRTFFRSLNHLKRQPVIIYGAEDSGLQLLNSLFHGYEYEPVALVDDNTDLQDLRVAGLTVFSPQKIPDLVQKTGARVVLLADPELSRVRRRQIVSALEDLHLEIKTIPDMSDIISGRTLVSELRAVSAEDLLGRDPIPPDPELLGKNITGKVVMVSGAGGSIGSELCRQVMNQNPEILILYEISEYALYQIEQELSATAQRLGIKTRVVPAMGSVRDSRRLETIIKTFGVQTIYHAAAYKHVPLVEENVIEGIQNNVFGTAAIVTAAAKLNVENFILISTDKAVRPTNIMGATKRIAELICQAQKTPGTVYSMVRFGNVLGSSGSVIPRFTAQIKSGGPVTVTHKDITRYFMTICEAAQLVIQAGALGKGGDVFVLDMGEPVKIVDLAMSMVKYHGLKPYLAANSDQSDAENGDIPVCITGLRKGEKLYEELLIGNNPSSTRHTRIWTASEVYLEESELLVMLDRLRQACEKFDFSEIMTILGDLPIEYAPANDDVSDLLWRSAIES